MRLLKGLVKVIQAILIFLVPVVIFYWFLTVINLEFIKPFQTVLGSLFIPFLSYIKLYYKFEVTYDNILVDFSPFVLAIAVLVVFIAFCWIEKALDITERALLQSKRRAAENKRKQEEEEEEIKFTEELANNKVVYFVLKFYQKETSNAYLFSGKEDIFGEGVLNTMINDVVVKAQDFKGKPFKEIESEESAHNFLFHSVTDAIDYAFYVHNKIADINKEVMDQGKKLYYGVASHCSYNEVTAKRDFPITTKILSLGNTNQIVVSELFRNKYAALKSETNLIFTSKGIYCINDQQMEIFTLKAK